MIILQNVLHFTNFGSVRRVTNSNNCKLLNKMFNDNKYYNIGYGDWETDIRYFSKKDKKEINRHKAYYSKVMSNRKRNFECDTGYEDWETYDDNQFTRMAKTDFEKENIKTTADLMFRVFLLNQLRIFEWKIDSDILAKLKEDNPDKTYNRCDLWEFSYHEDIFSQDTVLTDIPGIKEKISSYYDDFIAKYRTENPESKLTDEEIEYCIKTHLDIYLGYVDSIANIMEKLGRTYKQLFSPEPDAVIKNYKIYNWDGNVKMLTFETDDYNYVFWFSTS